MDEGRQCTLGGEQGSFTYTDFNGMEKSSSFSRTCGWVFVPEATQVHVNLYEYVS